MVENISSQSLVARIREALSLTIFLLAICLNGIPWGTWK